MGVRIKAYKKGPSYLPRQPHFRPTFFLLLLITVFRLNGPNKHTQQSQREKMYLDNYFQFIIKPCVILMVEVRV